jgi:flagellar motor component MotA
VVNYNATQGIIGAALGLVAWLSVLSGRWGPARA